MLWKKVLAAACRPAGCSRSPPGWSSSASARGWPSTAPTYWDVVGTFAPTEPKPSDPETFTVDARVASTTCASRPAATSTPPPGGRRPTSCTWTRPARAGSPPGSRAAPFSVQGVEEKPYRRRPYAPFMTSTLQQEAGRKFRWSAQQVMRIAQRLYENGFITYMRTDSTNLSETALTAARSQARELYGDAYVPAEPRIYTRKVKNAQEAHEAIRPPATRSARPARWPTSCQSEEFRLYELIWQRTLASQMADAVGTTVSVRIGGTSVTDEAGGLHDERADDHLPRLPARLRRGDRREPDGCGEGRRREAAAAAGPRRRPGPARVRGRPATPPRRRRGSPNRRWSRRWRSSASAVRPPTPRSCRRSRTAATCGRRARRSSRRGPRSPSSDLLESYFGRLVDYGFTASVENDLDDIASGERSRVDWLTRFYFGSADAPGRLRSASRRRAG